MIKFLLSIFTVSSLWALWASAEPLATNWCDSLDDSSSSYAMSITQKAKDILLNMSNGPFVRSTDGGFVTAVDSTSGIDNGGATNTDGFYQMVYLPGHDSLPKGMCDLPACSNTTVQECHTRCDPSSEQFWASSVVMGYSDVLVTTLCTPPTVKYYSYDTYISTRITEEYPFYPGQNFGTPISMSNIRIEGSDIFLQPAVIIQSADAAAARMVKDAFIEAGFSENAVNIRGIDVDTVRLWDRTEKGGENWKETAPDILFSISRVSVPTGKGMDKDNFEKYQKLMWPSLLLFANDSISAPAEPMSPPVAPRTSPDILNEVEVYGSLVEELRKSIIDGSVAEGYTLVAETSLDTDMLGYYDDWGQVLELKNNDSFVVGTRDATYGLPEIAKGDNVVLTETSRAVVFGVIKSGEESLNLRYSQANLALLNWITGRVLDTLTFMEDDTLKGSAQRYMSDQGDDSLLYAVDYRQPGQCDDEDKAFCIEFGSTDVKRATISMILGVRMYQQIETGLGPPANTTIAAKALYFQKI